MSRKKQKKQYNLTISAIVVGIVAAVTGGAAIAMAAIPDAQGMINGCHNSGKLRIIDTAKESCHTGEKAISWSKSGSTPVSAIKFAESPAEFSISRTQSEAAGNHVAISGSPTISFNVPAGSGNLVEFFSAADMKSECEEPFTTLQVWDEDNDSPVISNTHGLTVMFGLPNSTYRTFSSDDRSVKVPVEAGNHTYGIRYSADSSLDPSCAVNFKNVKFWAELHTPAS